MVMKSRNPRGNQEMEKTVKGFETSANNSRKGNIPINNSKYRSTIKRYKMV